MMPTTRKADSVAHSQGDWQTARAKINLALHVTGLDKAGYHTLDSLVTFTEWGDRLRFAANDDLSLCVRGPFAAGIDRDDNSVLEAAQKLGALSGSLRGAAVFLEKNMPVASGIGGGSADAAAVLKGLCRLWDVEPDNYDLNALALELGADVPMCLAGRPARIGGIGEVIDPLAIPSFPMVLVNPRIPLSTPRVFEALGKRDNTAISMPDNPDGTQGWLTALTRMRNDLTAPAVNLVPEIGNCLDALEQTPSCRLARMSGSGATCFGIFDSADSAGEAARRFGRDHGDWWSIATRSVS